MAIKRVDFLNLPHQLAQVTSPTRNLLHVLPVVKPRKSVQRRSHIQGGIPLGTAAGNVDVTPAAVPKNTLQLLLL